MRALANLHDPQCQLQSEYRSNINIDLASIKNKEYQAFRCVYLQDGLAVPQQGTGLEVKIGLKGQRFRSRRSRSACAHVCKFRE
jgi:hypothetical protein